MAGRAGAPNGTDGKDGHRPTRPRADYGGAIYGALLAASVVAGAGTFGPPSWLELALLLLITGLVFWVAHVYAHLVADRESYRGLAWAAVRRVARQEWPIVQAAVLPAVAAALGPLLGLDPAGTAWFALAIALAELVCWSGVTAVRAGASARLVVVSVAVNLMLGLIVVALKSQLHPH